MAKDQELTLKNWSDEDKPRERLLATGKKNMSTAELIAILLGSGYHGKSAVSVAQKLLQDHENNIANISRLSYRELIQYKGIGDAKAITLIAAFELGTRISHQSNINNINTILSSADTFHYISPKLIDLTYEEFWAIYLNNRGKVIVSKKVAEGGFSQVHIDMKKLFEPVLNHGVSRIIIAHNHPSGDLTPSQSDKKLTIKVQEAAKLLDTQLIDHIIVGVNGETKKENYFSFADNGILI